MTLQERIRRDDMEDKIYLGSLVEKATKGEFGDLFKLICNAVIDKNIRESAHSAKMNADRYLGRIEAINMIQDELVLMVEIKNNLTQEARAESRVRGAERD